MNSPGAKLNAMRRLVSHTCRCGKVFKGIKTAKHCSNRCKQAAKYERIVDKRTTKLLQS